MSNKEKIRIIKRYIEHDYMNEDGTIWHPEMSFIYKILCIDF